MINKDKFGNPIYSKPFNILLRQGKLLKKLGFYEPRNDNLFKKDIEGGRIYADMRSTEIVPIWSDTDPIIYWFWDVTLPLWKRRRIINKEIKNLNEIGCPWRLSFEIHDNEDFIDASVDGNEILWNDGYCKRCGKDFQNDGSFCEKCRLDYESKKDKCKACGEIIEFEKPIKHFTSFSPIVTVLVHEKCFVMIEVGGEYSHLKPPDEDRDRYLSSKDLKTKIHKLPGGCGRKTLTTVNDNQVTCSHCKSKNKRDNERLSEERLRKHVPRKTKDYTIPEGLSDAEAMKRLRKFQGK